MSQENRVSPRIEHLESRITPGVDATIGTLQVVDTTANPTYEWASQLNNVVLGKVIGTHTLKASLDVSTP